MITKIKPPCTIYFRAIYYRAFAAGLWVKGLEERGCNLAL
jgi:hypothetical protein